MNTDNKQIRAKAQRCEEGEGDLTFTRITRIDTNYFAAWCETQDHLWSADPASTAGGHQTREWRSSAPENRGKPRQERLNGQLHMRVIPGLIGDIGGNLVTVYGTGLPIIEHIQSEANNASRAAANLIMLQ
jgi:hypothetical protein